MSDTALDKYIWSNGHTLIGVLIYIQLILLVKKKLYNASLRPESSGAHTCFYISYFIYGEVSAFVVRNFSSM